jgi:hypothetical protein
MQAIRNAGKTFDLMASALPIGTLASVTSVLAAILFMGFALINPCGVLWIFGCPFVLFLLVIALSFLNILLVIKR